QRHEILRTIFTISEGKPRQVIIPALPMVLPLIDLTFLPTSEREDEMIHCSTKEMHRPFDLASGPLMRAYLLQMNHDEHIFLLSFHHIISDGWSISIFFQEFAALYCAFSNRQPSPLPELPIQYADFAVWQRRWLKEEVFQDQLIYW